MPRFPHLLLLTLLFAPQVQAYDFQNIAKQHVIPIYHRLADRTLELQQVAATYCEAPSPEAMKALRLGYEGAFLAWQGAQHIRFGPVQYLAREHRFTFWPDKRGTVGKHLASLLADPALASDSFDISQKSVAVQGFSALERLLFGSAAPDESGCRVINAITANLSQMSDTLLQDWVSGEDRYLDYFAQPGPGNPIFGSTPELAGQLLNSLHTQIEFIVTQKLARPLGSSLEKARGKRAEGWRSKTAWVSISTNLAASHALYRAVFAPELQSEDTHLLLHHEIDETFDQAEEHLQSISPPLADAVSDAAQREQVEQLQRALARLQGLLGNELATTLGLSLGFNSLDGD